MTDEQISAIADAQAAATMATMDLVQMACRIGRFTSVSLAYARDDLAKVRKRLDTIEAALNAAEQEEAAA